MVMNRDGRIAFLAIFLLAATICFTGLLCPLQEPQESRYAEIPRQMLAEGSVVVPLLHGQPYYDKPPLFYWLVMASYSVFGVNESAARLVPCVAAFLTILISFGWAHRLLGWRAAFLGSAMLCLAPRFVQLDRMLTPDSLLTLFVVAAWASGQLALTSTLTGDRLHRGWWLASALACGLGLLTKGPVALVLVVPVLLALRARWRMLAAYLAVSVGLAAPWFIAVAMRDESFLAYFFWFHHVQRYVDPFDHSEPFWFYLPEVVVGMLPWTLLLPGLMVALIRGGDEVQHLRSLVFAGLWCVGFFSLSGCKRGFYVLPAVPPLALALGGYLDRVLGETSCAGWFAIFQHRSRLAFLVILFVIVGVLTGCIAGFACDIVSGKIATIFGLAAAIGGLTAIGIYGKRGGQASWAEAGCAMTLQSLAGVFLLLPGYAEKFSLRNDLVCNLANGFRDAPIFCYPKAWDSVNFYLGREDVRAFKLSELDRMADELAQTPGAVVMVRTGFAGAVQDKLPASVRWELLGRPGHLTVGRVVASTAP
jgi:4-amino-4-deoxy-L-arabinose transferase-like glycosyltransferase